MAMTFNDQVAPIVTTPTREQALGMIADLATAKPGSVPYRNLAIILAKLELYIQQATPPQINVVYCPCACHEGHKVDVRYCTVCIKHNHRTGKDIAAPPTTN